MTGKTADEEIPLVGALRDGYERLRRRAPSREDELRWVEAAIQSRIGSTPPRLAERILHLLRNPVEPPEPEDIKTPMRKVRGTIEVGTSEVKIMREILAKLEETRPKGVSEGAFFVAAKSRLRPEIVEPLAWHLKEEGDLEALERDGARFWRLV
jgi:hypothetical protein